MEAYPFQHRDLIFQVLTDLDLPFIHVREILDWLIDRGVFPEPGEAGAEIGEGEDLPYTFYLVPAGDLRYSVVVLGWEVMVLPEGAAPERRS